MIKNKSKRGFTIIEVVLVLAIAGLIFLMVFVGLPALQRSQRDAQRKQDMDRLVAALVQYQANNNGATPVASKEDISVLYKYNTFIDSYLTTDNNTFKDPSTGETYRVNAYYKCAPDGSCNNAGPTMGKIHVYYNAACDGQRIKYAQGDNRNAFILLLEGGGYYCVNN